MTTTTLTTSTSRQAPWVGIGTKGEWKDYRDALMDSGLDFTVRQEQLYWNKDVGSGVSMAEEAPMFANVRNRDDKALGYVSNGYGVVQNEDAFALLEPFTDAGGIITNAGMTEQGLCFMVLHMQQQEFLGDTYNFDVMCCNSFNTMFPLSLIMVPTRIICQNMYRRLMGNNDALLKLRHGINAESRLKMASAAVGAIGSYTSAFGLTLEQANNNKLSSSDVENMVALLFPYPKPGGAREHTSRERIDYLRSEFMDKYYNASDNWKYHGTGMGFLNAYYDFLSHRDPGKNMPGSWEDRRLSSLVSGNIIKDKLIHKSIH